MYNASDVQKSMTISLCLLSALINISAYKELRERFLSYLLTKDTEVGTKVIWWKN